MGEVIQFPQRPKPPEEEPEVKITIRGAGVGAGIDAVNIARRVFRQAIEAADTQGEMGLDIDKAREWTVVGLDQQHNSPKVD